MSTVTTMTLADWRAELERRGSLDCKFVCPVCGNEASPNDWKALLPDLKTPDRAAVECIGRAMPADQRRRAFPTEAEPDAPERPCDYAAFGLLNICKVMVERGSGKPQGVFEFAETPA